MRSKQGLRIIIYDPSGRGGICHYTYQLAENLAQAANDVTVVTPEVYELEHLRRSFKLKKLFKKSWVKSFIIWMMVKTHWSADRMEIDGRLIADQRTSAGRKLVVLLRILKRQRVRIVNLKAALLFVLLRPHLIHFQFVSRHEDYSLIKLLKFLRFTIIYTAHDLLPHDVDSLDERRAFQKIYRLADRLIVHSESDKEEMISLFDVEPHKISIVPHGSNDLFYERKDLSKQAARHKIGIPQEKKTILFFGQIKRYKGLEYLLEAYTEIRQKVNNTMLLIAGKLHDGDTETVNYYSPLIRELYGFDDVKCINEYIAFESVGYYFAAADIVVLPYNKTYQSGVLLSAYAAGRAVIVTDTGGLREVVEEGKSGLVVPPKDAKALAQAIMTILQNPCQIEEMGRYAKHLAETAYSWRTVASKTIHVYRSLGANSRVSDQPGDV